MKIACFCGLNWEADDDTKCCPACGAILKPAVSDKDREQMEAELRAILEEHSG